MFAPGSFPQGEILEQPGVFNSYRVTSEEKRAADRAQDDLYDRVRHASEVHRQARCRVTLGSPRRRLVTIIATAGEAIRAKLHQAGHHADGHV